MNRYHFAQTDGQLGGAANAMVTMAEFGAIAPNKLTKETEQKIWKNIRQDKDDEESESPIAFLANFFIGNNRKVNIFEDTNRITALRKIPEMDKAYKQHVDELITTGIKDLAAGVLVKNAPLSLASFNNDAHVILVAIIKDTGLTHYVLARKDKGDIWVMNPDGGTDTKQPNLIKWATGAVGEVAKIGNLNYIFSGVYLRVT